jgi:hypothetical protein
MAHFEVLAHAELNIDLLNVSDIIFNDITLSPVSASCQMGAYNCIEIRLPKAHIFLLLIQIFSLL